MSSAARLAGLFRRVRAAALWGSILLVTACVPAAPGELPTLAVLPDLPPTHTAQPIPTQSPNPTFTAAPDTPTPAPVVPATQAAATLLEPLVVAPPEQPVSNQFVIQFAPQSTEAERAAYIQSTGGIVTTSIDALDTVVIQLPDSTAIESLPPAPVLAASEPDYYVSALADDPRFAEQWALPVIGAPDVWPQIPADAPVITVAVIDSGICASHPDLQGRVLPGYDFVENDDDPQDDLGHGCGVAGVIAANTDNAIGISGIAPNTQILPLRVLDGRGLGLYSDVAAAIVWAADSGAQIINLSLGGANASTTLESAVNYAVGQGVLVIAAAGNTGGSVLYPAAYDAVIAVGAVDPDLQMSSFSSRGPQIDVLAPGRNILATSTQGDYTLMSGSSFAAPHVAGVAALEMALGRSLSLNGGVVAVGGMPIVQAATPTLSAPATDTTPIPTQLFLSTNAQGALSMSGNRGVMRSRYVDINFNVIPQAGAAAAQSVNEISFNLFDDTTLVMTQDRIEPSSVSDNGYVWVGQMPGDELSLAILSVGDGQVEGLIETQDARYQVTYAGNGVHAVNQIDTSAFDMPIDDARIIDIPPDFTPEPGEVDANSLWVIDVLVVYTPNARVGQGGVTAMQNAIQLAVVETNQAYINSGINMRLNLVMAEEITYAESGSLGIDLDRLTLSGDGFMDTVHTRRNTLGADLVVLIREQPTDACGIAWVSVAGGFGAPAFGFSVVARECMLYAHTFAHEVGHNMGAHHDRPNANSIGAYAYSYGYVEPQGRFRTIMSYSNNCALPCPVINYFSNTTHTLAGRALGNTQTNNALTHNNTASIVASYRNGPNLIATPTFTPIAPVVGPFTPVAPATPIDPSACQFTIPPGNTAQLVSAISAANNNGFGNDNICLSAGSTYTFTSGPYTNFYGANALPFITSNITIEGNGATITRNASVPFRFVYMDGDATLQLNNVTLNNGRCSTSFCYGGAILNAFGQIRITDSRLSGNVAQYGGAIFSNGSMDILNSAFSGNSAEYGGAIYTYGNSFSPLALNIMGTLMYQNSGELGGVLSISSGVNTTIDASCFIRNTNVSIYNTDFDPAPTVNAQNNWWGRTYGPGLTSGENLGGDMIEANWVNYIPFLQLRPEHCTPTPVAIGPAGSTTINPPTFSWQPAPDAVGYEIQYGDTNPPFITVSTTATTYKPSVLLLSKLHFWRVRALLSDGGYSSWSAVQTLNIALAANAAPPRHYFTTATPRLTWNRFTGATGYEVQVSAVATFAGTPIFTTVLPATALGVTTDPLIDGLYYWRVRARRSNNTWGAWSAAETFAVDVP